MKNPAPSIQPNLAFLHKKVACRDTNQSVIITYRISNSAFNPKAKMVTHLECFGQNICPSFCRSNLCPTLEDFQQRVLAEKDLH